MSLSQNEKIAENFVRGIQYLKEFNRDTELRAEFEGDFEAYAWYRQACEAGSVKSFGKRV